MSPTSDSSHPDLTFREATRQDLERIVEMLNDDPIEGKRSGAFGPAHIQGFNNVASSPNNELIVAELEGGVVGVMQLTFIPGITRNGATSMKLEAIRVDAALRSQGIGRLMVQYAEQRAQDRGCGLIQLDSHRDRHNAHRFYVELGYAQSHVGFKKVI